MQPHVGSSRDAAPACIVWDECACLLCGEADYVPLLESADYVSHVRFLIVRCKRCGLCFTNPRPDPVSIQPFYPNEYRCHQTPNRKDRRRQEPLAKWLPPRGMARLLDVGCGGGGFLLRMHGLGWNVTGLDASENAVSQLRALGLAAHLGTLPQPAWQDASFDAITFWQSLEHLHQPLEALQEARRLLTKGGTLMVAVPNFESWAARYFSADWYGLDLPRHLTHFTPATLTAILQQAGFTQFELRQESHHSWVRHSAIGRSGLVARMLRSRLGSSLAGRWASACGLAEGLLIQAAK